MAISSANNYDFMSMCLRSIGKVVTPLKQSNFCIVCVNPDHQDSDPSLSIHMSGSMARCFSCGWTGSWYKIAKLLSLPNLPGFGKKLSVTEEAKILVNELEHVEEITASTSPNFPKNIEPWKGGPFRGFSESILEKLQTKLWHDFGNIKRIFWPFLQKGKLLGGTGRILPECEPGKRIDESPEDFKVRLKAFYKSGVPKYKNLKGNKVKQVLFPYDHVQRTKTIVLVEGPTSCIRLLDLNVPALAILGVENWDTLTAGKETGLKKALLLAKGVQNVVLMFDGDPAGRKATREIAKDLEPYVSVYPVNLPNGVDPYDMNQKWVDFLQTEISKLM